MTWRERLVAAEERQRLWNQKGWFRKLWDLHSWEFPFTGEDVALGKSLTTCAANELAETYGLNPLGRSMLMKGGTVLFKAILLGRLSVANRTLDEMEDFALFFKRHQDT